MESDNPSTNNQTIKEHLGSNLKFQNHNINQNILAKIPGLSLEKLQDIKTYKIEAKGKKNETNNLRYKEKAANKKSLKLNIYRKKKAMSKGNKKLRHYLSEKTIKQDKPVGKNKERFKESREQMYIALMNNNHFINVKYKNGAKKEKNPRKKSKAVSHNRHKSNMSLTKKALSKNKIRHQKNNSLLISMIAKNFKKSGKLNVKQKKQIPCVDTRNKNLKKSCVIQQKKNSVVDKEKVTKKKKSKNNRFKKGNLKNEVQEIIIEEDEFVNDNVTPFYSNQNSPQNKNSKALPSGSRGRNSLKNYFFNLNSVKNKGKKVKLKNRSKADSAIENVNKKIDVDMIDGKKYKSRIEGLSHRKVNDLHPSVLAEFNPEAVIKLINTQKDNAKRSTPKFHEVFKNLSKDKETADVKALKRLIADERKKNSQIPETTLQFYQVIKLLGKGSFGKVFLGLQRLTNRLVAMKCLEKNHLKDENTKRKILTEVKILKQLLGHPNIVKVLEVFETKKYVFFVTEYATNGDLLKHLKTDEVMPETKAKHFFYQIASGLSYIHSQGIIHRDIKLDNILVDENERCKICDFGVSREIKPNEIINEQCGTPAYLAPEIIKDEGYSGFAVDIWSLGVLLFSLLTGSMPFKAGTIEELHKKILAGKYEIPKEAKLSKEVVELIGSMLVVDPEHRINIQAVLKHNWLKNLDFERRTIFDIKEFDKRKNNYLEEFDYEVNEFALGSVVELGFDKKMVEKGVLDKELNHATACYFNLEKDFV